MKGKEEVTTLLPILCLLVVGNLASLVSSALVTESYSTVRAVPLQDELDNDDNIATEVDKEEVISTTETTTSPSPPTTVSLTSPSTSSFQPQFEGQIAWAPYSEKNATKSSISPINLPMFLPSFLQPTTVSPVKGRWLSRDKEAVQLINSRPAFIYPQIPVQNSDKLAELKNSDKFSARSKNKKRNQGWKQEGRRRVKRGSGTKNNKYVALCGGVFREIYGVIQSPDYPLYYPNNKKCVYDIEVPSDYTIKLTCEKFIMQGGDNCTHDYLMVETSTQASEVYNQKFCGISSPVVISNSTRMTVTFKSDDLFRYQGFSCRYRALLPDGNAAPGTFGNSTDNTQSGLTSNNFLQIVQCPTNAVVNTNDPHSVMDAAVTSGQGGAASLYSGVWDGRCGNQNQLPPINRMIGGDSLDRIVGGYPTAEHQFPWMAAVLRTCTNEYCHICGATIISEEWVLTGAHCMVAVPMEELGVLVGDHSLFTISTSQKFIKVKEKVVHPDYNMKGMDPSPLNNDIGLLRLEYPIIFTSQISPMCLPALGETGFEGSGSTSANASMLDTNGVEIVGKNATVLGWGTINDQGDFSDSLRGAEVEILENDYCNQFYGIMTDNMMCTSGADARGSCFGDSGGPAIVKQTDGSWVQVGIIAFGAQDGCEVGYPSGQTLVHKFIDWIQSVTNIAFGHNLG